MKAAACHGRAALVLAFLLGPAAGASAQDSGWPREFTTPKGNTVVFYQPQIETFKGDTFTARAALSFTKKDETAPRFGVVFFAARASVDRDARTVTVLGIEVSRVRFPNITDEREKKFAAILEEEVPKLNIVVSYDRVLESVRAAEREQKSAQGLRNDPPRILFAEEPTVLVTLDGEPELKDVEGAPLRMVLNTPFLMVLDTRDNRYYLSGGRNWWYRSQDPKGPWQAIGGPPSEIAQMKAKVDAQAKTDTEADDGDDGTESAKPPKVLVSTEPAELIVSEGKPSFKPVSGVDLLYMDNTESEVLLDVPSQEYYTLLSGRWFRSKSLTAGAWTYVAPDALPASFSKIAPESDIGDVLASVPGTDEAEDAVLDAQIPQTAAVKRAEASLDVQYDGQPEFISVEGTRTEYAVNASTSVLRIRGRYYACDNAVWYVADAPGGPWLLADSIPRDEVESLPPSVPVYNVKYVHIYDATPDVVYVGYTPGYLGCYPWHGTVVWGTGWHYRPWIGRVYYWPRPYTWGFHAHYSPWTGWGFGVSWSYPFYNVSAGWGGVFRPVGWGYRPGYRGSGWHRAGWWGPGGYRPPVNIVNNIHIHPGNWNRPGRPGYTRPMPGRPGSIRPIPGSRPNVGFRPPVKDVRPERLPNNNIYNRLPAKSREVPRPVTREVPRSAKPARENNVYADRNGEIYRTTRDGGWQRREKSGWRNAPGVEGAPRPTKEKPAARPAPAPAPPPRAPVARPAPLPELNRDYTARQRGETRVRESSEVPVRAAGGSTSRGGGKPAAEKPQKQKK